MKITAQDITSALESGESEAASGSYVAEQGVAPAIAEALRSSEEVKCLLIGESFTRLTREGCSPRTAIVTLLAQYTMGVESGIAIAEARQLPGVPVESR